MLRGYKRKTKPANWLSVEGAEPVRGPAKPSAEDRARRVRARRGVKSLAQSAKARPVKPYARQPRVKTAAQKTAASEKALYRQEARAYVAAAVARGERCPVVAAVPELRDGRKYGWPISDRLVEVHHKRGRGRGGRGPLLRDQRHWMPISKQGHRWVHSNIAKARGRGWVCAVGEWNKPDLTP